MNRQELERFYVSPIDYSSSFTSVVEEMKNYLINRIGIHVIHDNDMNYSASQKLVLFLDEKGNLAKDDLSAKIKLVIFISSKGKLVTFLLYPRSGSNSWGPASFDNTEAITSICPIMKDLAAKFGYQIAFGPVLHKEVEGYETDMDGKRATVFEILFSELY